MKTLYIETQQSTHLQSSTGSPSEHHHAPHILRRSCCQSSFRVGLQATLQMVRSRSSSSGVSYDSSNCPKPQASGYPLDNLAAEWDNTPEVRDQMRAGDHLMKAWNPTLMSATNDFVDHTVENIRANACVLSAVFKRMAQHERDIPCIDRIMDQVRDLYQRCKVTFTKHQDRVYQDSWAVRRMCTYAKAQRYRDGPPKEPRVKETCFIHVCLKYLPSGKLT